ncbi:MAG: amidase [Ruminococcus sp.]|nr:amidase [Ruminococcus sp.]
MATWSPLTNKVRESKDNSGNRKYSVTRITPHCWVGQVSIENGLDYFATTSRQVSSNYIIGSDGRVGGCVREEYRAWTSSSRDNDNRAITIECASDTKSPYAFKTAVYNKLILLCADICKRYGKKKLLWISDKSKALSYNPKSDEMLLTVHRWFASTDCPGSWLMSRMGDLANQVTAILQGETPTTDTYTVCTNGNALRIREKPTTNSKQVGYIPYKDSNGNRTTFKSDKVVKGQNIDGVDTWVYYNGGYASGRYLSPTPVCPDPAPTPTPTPPTPVPTGKKYLCTCKIGVNIRAGAGVSYKKVGAVNYGQTVTIYTQKNGWGNTTSSGNRWVCMKYFKAV